MGTVDYCAPEQIKGGEIDGRADVYSLGCVLFECLTGAPPFRKDTEVATIYAHLEEDVPKASFKRPGLSALLSSVVAKAMAKRPDDRFATAGEMAEALRGSSGPRLGPRRRFMLIGLGAVLALLVVGGDPRVARWRGCPTPTLSRGPLRRHGSPEFSVPDRSRDGRDCVGAGEHACLVGQSPAGRGR